PPTNPATNRSTAACVLSKPNARRHQNTENPKMFPQATILLYKEETPEDLHLARLTEFWGVQWRMVRLDLANELDKILSGREILPCLLVNACALGVILQGRA